MRGEKPTRDEGAHDADDDVADQSEPRAPHHKAGKPPRDGSDDDPDENFRRIHAVRLHSTNGLPTRQPPHRLRSSLGQDRSRDDVGRRLIVQIGDAITQDELTLLKSL